LGFTLPVFTVEDHRLRVNWADPITVGELPIHVATAMGLRVPLVSLSRASLAHINQKHPDNTDYQLLYASRALQRGLIAQEHAKPHIYLCSYMEPHSKMRYGMAMKIATPDREVYLQSFYRVSKRQTKSWVKRCVIIKTHT
jgi:hypothetical protein